MKKWDYTLKNSKKLRNAIKEENYNDVLQTLLICYREVINYFICKGITDQRILRMNIIIILKTFKI